MQIDIIIPTFNRSATLQRAIESVLNQTYKDYYLYIVDDGSTDNSKDIIATYLDFPNIFYLKQENKGVSAARNFGIQKSKSPWIAFLDSDDEWLPNKLQTQVSFWKDNPQYNFIHSNEIWIRNNKRVNAPLKFDKSNNNIFERSLATCLISPSTVLMKRSLGDEFHFFDESLTICEDYDLWLKILLKEEVGFIPEYLIKKYGGHNDQLSTMYDAMDLWRIQSLLNISKNEAINSEKKYLIQKEIWKKANILLNGLKKHNQLEKHRALIEQIENAKII